MEVHPGNLTCFVLCCGYTKCIDYVLAVSFENHLSIRASEGNKKLGHSHLKCRVEVKFGLLDDERIAWSRKQTSNQDRQQLRIAKAGIGDRVDTLSGGCT